MAGYFGPIASVFYGVLAPFINSSGVVPRLQELPSILEGKVEQNGRLTHGNGHNHAYNPFLMVPFQRGGGREERKSPAYVPQNNHGGHQTPREFYRKVAEHK